MTGQKAAAFFPSAADSDLDFASRARRSFFVAANEASVLFEEATSLFSFPVRSPLGVFRVSRGERGCGLD